MDCGACLQFRLLVSATELSTISQAFILFQIGGACWPKLMKKYT